MNTMNNKAIQDTLDLMASVNTKANHPMLETPIPPNVRDFRIIAEEICTLYEYKNKAYGNSFGDTYAKLGIISAVTRISDKYNRICNLVIHPDINDCAESISDTLRDLAAYCIMTLMEFEKPNRNDNQRD